MTALDIITSSLRMIGVLAAGESPSANEAVDALTVLNDLLDNWGTQKLLMPNSVRETFPLYAGTEAYTIGYLGTMNTLRPQKIEKAIIQITDGDQVLELPMKILNQDEYAGIILKEVESTYPQYLYNDNAFPLANINIWPVPSADGNNLVLYSWKPIPGIGSLSDFISVPPGYSRALKYNLALELSAEYGKAVSEVVASIAASSMADIKRMNTTPRYLQVDDALRSKPAVWNWMTGEPT